MKTFLLIAGGLICSCSWHANAQDLTTNPTGASQNSAVKIDSEGPDATGSSMSGGPAAVHGQTRSGSGSVSAPPQSGKRVPGGDSIDPMYRGG